MDLGIALNPPFSSTSNSTQFPDTISAPSPQNKQVNCTRGVLALSSCGGGEKSKFSVQKRNGTNADIIYSARNIHLNFWNNFKPTMRGDVLLSGMSFEEKKENNNKTIVAIGRSSFSWPPPKTPRRKVQKWRSWKRKRERANDSRVRYQPDYKEEENNGLLLLLLLCCDNSCAVVNCVEAEIMWLSVPDANTHTQNHTHSGGKNNLCLCKRAKLECIVLDTCFYWLTLWGIFNLGKTFFVLACFIVCSAEILGLSYGMQNCLLF